MTLTSHTELIVQGGPNEMTPLTFLLVTNKCIHKNVIILVHINYIKQQMA